MKDREEQHTLIASVVVNELDKLMEVHGLAVPRESRINIIEMYLRIAYNTGVKDAKNELSTDRNLD